MPATTLWLTAADCGATYGKSSHLNYHLLRHAGERPFVCTWPE